MQPELRLVHYWLIKTNGTPDEWFVGKFHTWGQRSDGEQTDFFAIVEASDGECYELDSTQIKFINADPNNTVTEKEKEPDQCNCTPYAPPNKLPKDRLSRIIPMEHSIVLELDDGNKYLYHPESVITFWKDSVYIDCKNTPVIVYLMEGV